ncbi:MULTISPECIES: LrgB family protein [Brevibacillus]|jgi:putative effector of murein hydrolase|uniref:LrgB family protein n=1 Tax=Brevibacillus TaxID=55080 RepID=UPI00046ABC3E|nr:LrgB family protein [Brevibacillus borstelensis]KKX55932.1 effector of murein hydrolase LrgA [Brevibacillus borstelensis cifa_chp40]MBE5396755.1 LrgB family protein [Brevibacillus borstelensis]MED2007627.1 LrgB family protein [Brevibacillus borstelensis]NOU57711.1 LrgB family protein [Brevibacillus borstelensis]
MLSPLLAIIVTLAAYKMAMYAAARFPIIQPVLVASVCAWFIWWVINGDWDAYRLGGDWISFWVGPATVALAVPLAKQIREFAHIWRGVLLGVGAGCAVAILTVFGVGLLFGTDDVLTKSMLTKSVTTPIAVELSKNIGGVPALAAFFTALTGIVGIAFARPLLALVGVKDDWAIGIAVGTSAHAIGTASLNRVSQVQTAASSVAMIMAGVVTAIYLIPFSL